MAEREYYPMSFEIDGDTPQWPGFGYGRYWNGWACPLFEYETAKEIMATFYTAPAEMHDQFPVEWWEYDAKADCFRGVMQGQGPDDIDEWPGEDILIDGQSKHVYPVGAGAWIWDESLPEEK